MYRLVVNTPTPRKIIISPLRIVRIQGGSPTIGEKVCHSYEGDVLRTVEVQGRAFLYKHNKDSNQLASNQLSKELYPNNLQLKSQALFLSNIQKPQLMNILKATEQRKENIQLFQIIRDPNCKNQLVSIIIYFNNTIISQEVYNELLETYQLFVLYIQEVLVIKLQCHEEMEKEILCIVNQVQYVREKEEGREVKYIQLPTCLSCLLRIQHHISGLPKRLNFPTSSPQHCQTCQFIDSTPPDLHCYQCQQTKDKWICMVCSTIGCGRYKNADAFKHFISSGHILTMELQTQRIWNYHSDCFSHRLMQIPKQESTLKFPDYSQKKAHQMYQESVQSAFWEYCSLVSEQLERQRVFYQKQKAKEEDKFQNESIATQKALLSISKQFDSKDQEVKKLAKKNKKLNKKLIEIKQKCKEDRQLLTSYDSVLNQTLKEPSLEQIQKDSPIIQQKLKILLNLQQEIENTLIQLTQ